MNESRLLPERGFAAVAMAAVALAALTACGGGLTVSGTNPAAGATGVSPSTAVSITFSEPLDAATIDASKFTLTPNGGAAVGGTVTVSGSTATFTPDAELQGNTAYQAQVASGVKAQGGAQLGEAHGWSFTTNNQTTFSVTSTDPANGASGVSPTVITITLSAEVNAASVSTTTVLFDGDPTPVAATVAASGNTITVTPTAALDPMWMYRIRLVGVTSAGGASLPPYTFTFATVTGADTGIAGRITYDWVPAASSAEGGEKLDYARIQARPARRIRVEATVNGAGSPLVTITNDHGFYEFPSIGAGSSVQIRAFSALDATGYVADGRGPEACNGANWDVDVVDNTSGQALYALADTAARTAPAPDVNLHAATTFSGGAYGQRAGAPFALADTFVSVIEKVCQGSPNFTIPHLNANWSPNNVAQSGDPAQGNISTSHYQHPAGGPNLYILGDADSDTDEYDDHVVAHEFGHFLEDTLYRSDSVGGQHGPGDILDPRVAFGEGYGNGLSAIAFDDPTYVDTNGSRQAGGFEINMDAAPAGNDRGVYSETSVQHFVWMLYENRDATPSSGSFDRIHHILRDFQRPSPALTTVQTFASYYLQEYGAAAESLQTLWEGTLAGDFDSLCSGSCAASGNTADPFDLDNDLGQTYASTRTYFGAARAADFWRLYKTISGAGFAPPGDAHDVTLDTRVHNRFGAQRYYRYVGTGAAKTAKINQANSANCNRDVLDVDLFETGLDDFNNGATGPTAGCPEIPVPGLSGLTYILVVNGFPSGSGAQDVPGFGVALQ